VNDDDRATLEEFVGVAVDLLARLAVRAAYLQIQNERRLIEEWD
jgi:hypothetical protein